MTILFLLQTHKDPEHLKRLVSLLRKGCPTSQVLICHDEKAPPLPTGLFAEDAHVHLTSGRGGRGDFLIIDGYLKALAWLRDHQIEYDWLINLSGADFPVTSLKGFEEELARTQHDGFLHHFDVLTQAPAEMAPMSWAQHHGYDRYYYQYRKYKPELNQFERKLLAFPRIFAEKYLRFLRINTAYGLMIGTHARNHPFKGDFKCYAGSYWHTIRRECAEYMLDFCEEHPETVEYFRHVLVPDESFIQTVLVNNRRFRFHAKNRRYFDMSKSRHGHPKLLTEADLPSILGADYFFARKLERASGETVFSTLEAVALS